MDKIGLIAGNGRFPLLAAKEAIRLGHRVICAAIEGEADPALEKIADQCRWVKLGQIKKLASFFREHGVREALMAGKVEKVRLFQENVSPDMDMMKLVMKARDLKDDTLLGAVAKYLEKQGVTLLDSTVFLKELLPGPGVLGKKRPSRELMETIRFGFRTAKALAGLDIGQTVIVKKKAILAVEAIEGTDQAIRRGGALGAGKIVIVKVAKPDQDMRFDVPAVGLRTMDEMIAVKAEAFAFEARKTIFMDQEDFVDRANRHGIALVGLEDTGL
ncbi:MAG: LpxI family protein [Candidatus Omnitrophota bacterium]